MTVQRTGADHACGREVKGRPRSWPAPSQAGFAMAGGALLAAAAGLAALVAVHPLHPLTLGADRDWLAMIRHTRDHVLTVVAQVTSLVGGPTGGSVVVAVTAAWLWLVRRRRIGAVFLVSTLVLTSAASQLIKHWVFRPRPPAALVHADIGSFPSGHVITTLAVGLALAMVLAWPAHRRVPLAAVAAATLVMMWCRTYLGAHWLSDTVESIFVGAGLFLGLWASTGKFVEREAREARNARDAREEDRGTSEAGRAGE